MAPDATIDDLSVDNGNAPHAIGRYLTKPEVGHAIDQALNPQNHTQIGRSPSALCRAGPQRADNGEGSINAAYTWQLTAHSHGSLTPPATWRPRKNRQSLAPRAIAGDQPAATRSICAVMLH
jgi:hypothetical protein